MLNQTKTSVTLPYIALVLNALVWGLSWWPLRTLHAAGLHPLWSSSLTYLLGCVVIIAFYPSLLRQFAQNKSLWVLSISAGTTMVGFNWGVATGDVVRVVLLFYLMPIWAVLLARVVLGEPLRPAALVPVGLAILGATLVLSRPGQISFPWPNTLADFLGLLGGIAFALNNIMLRHQQEQTHQLRLFGMFAGGVIIPAVVGLCLTWMPSLGNALHSPPWPGTLGAPLALLTLLGFAALLLLANLGLQYGAARLPAGITAVVMLSEVLFATLSSVLWGQQTLNASIVTGGSLILLAATLSMRLQSPPHSSI